MAKRSSRRRRVDAFLQSSDSPVFFVDRQRRVTFFNAGCEALTGWKADELLGRVCHYETGADSRSVEALTGALCPPPQVFSGKAVCQPIQLVLRDGRALPRNIDFHPVCDAEGKVALVLGFLSPAEVPPAPSRVPAAQRLHGELSALRSALRQRYALESLVARSRPMRRVAEQIAAACRSNASVLLTGEPGTGKEHVARIIHNGGLQRDTAFVPLDCRDIPAREIRRTLRRLLSPPDGAGDEAPSLPPGARPGTLFLQNAESLPRDLQEMLVELVSGQWWSGGWFHARPQVPASLTTIANPQSASPGEQPRPPEAERSAPVRLMASTTADFRRALADERLRDDYYYLLTTIEIALPPLRARPADLEPLAQAFLEERNRSGEDAVSDRPEKQIGGFSEAVWEQFRQYRWPGNLDELIAVIAEARDRCEGTLIDAARLPFRFRTGLDAQREGPPVHSAVRPLEEHLTEVETRLIREALEQARHNKALAAKLLGISRPRLYRRMETLGIEDVQQRQGEGAGLEKP